MDSGREIPSTRVTRVRVYDNVDKRSRMLMATLERWSDGTTSLRVLHPMLSTVVTHTARHPREKDARAEARRRCEAALNGHGNAAYRRVDS